MRDLIERQAAIEALGEEPSVWYDGEDEIAERNQWRRDVTAIKELPSAQPEIKTDGDTISRQAAIDAILAVTGNSSVRELYEHVQEHGLSDMWSGGVNAAIDIIIAVPSAQSEKSTTAEKSQLAEEKSTRKLIYLDDAFRIVESFYKVNADIRRIMAFELRQLPSAQPERKKGHWVEIGDEPYDEWECDMCGFVIDGSGCIDPEEYRDVYKFCPNCGADMREENT